MEAAFPFILQNLHRYFLYLAFFPLFFLWVDAVVSMFPPSGGFRLGLGVGILFVNAALLSGYSLSCHSLRHLVGGQARLLLVHAGAPGSATRVWQRAHDAEPAPHVLGVVEPPGRDLRRRLRPAAGARGHRGPGHRF